MRKKCHVLFEWCLILFNFNMLFDLPFFAFVLKVILTMNQNESIFVF